MVANSETLPGLKVAIVFDSRMKMRSIAYSRLVVLQGQMGKMLTVPTPVLCHRLPQMTAGSVAAGIVAIEPAGYVSSVEDGSIIPQIKLISVLRVSFHG